MPGLQGETAAVLVLHTHHSIMDGSSLQVAMKDLGAIHQGLSAKHAPELRELPIQYSDFAQWQHNQQQAGAWEPHVDFWKEHLAGAPDALDLPADVPDAGKKQGHEGHWLQLQLDAELADGMRTLATRCQASLLALTVAAFQVISVPVLFVQVHCRLTYAVSIRAFMSFKASHRAVLDPC